MDLVKFWTICSSNSIVLDLEQVHRIERYAKELKYWNEKVNLISRKDEDNIFDRHILHSLTIAKYVHFPPKSKVLDIGTGGGLPGIPVKIAYPEIDLLMIDSIHKKIKITEMLAKHTHLRKIEAKCIRAELLANNVEYIRKFDFIISRAVAKIDQIVEWSFKLLKKKGKFVLLKGGDLRDEINQTLEKFESIKIQEIEIDMIGVPAFKQDNKKIIICNFD